MLGNFPLEVHRAKQLQCHRNLCSTWLIESSVKQGRIAKTDIFDKQIGVNMNMYQTNRAIKTLRSAAHSAPLPMELHDQITASLIDLLRHRIALKEAKKNLKAIG